ncbi:MAG: hypothetical protein K2Y71_27710 [Xanthobacteraceae bacterium]|nr:hypothetical protein [Xanthobacteraceae bacterium]
MHVDEHVPLVLLLDEPPRALEAIVSDIVSVRTGFGFEPIFLQLVGVRHAGFRQDVGNMSKDFVFRWGLEHPRGKDPLVETKEQSGVDVFLWTGQRLKKRVRQIAKELRHRLRLQVKARA